MARSIVYASPWIDEDSDDSITHRIIAHVPEFKTIRCDTYGVPSEASAACYATHIQLSKEVLHLVSMTSLSARQCSTRRVDIER